MRPFIWKALIVTVIAAVATGWVWWEIHGYGVVKHAEGFKAGQNAEKTAQQAVRGKPMAQSDLPKGTVLVSMGTAKLEPAPPLYPHGVIYTENGGKDLKVVLMKVGVPPGYKFLVDGGDVLVQATPPVKLAMSQPTS